MSKAASSLTMNPNVGILSHPGADLSSVIDVKYNLESYKCKRGLAYIFSNESFDDKEALPDLPGTHKDADNFKKTLERFGFEAKVFRDMSKSAIVHERDGEVVKLSKNSAALYDVDCLLICVMTHGDCGGILYAKDKEYPIKDLWMPFIAKSCPALAKKPKVFIMQACRGEKFDKGKRVFFSQTDGPTKTRNYEVIPNHSDFLFGYSTVPEYVSYVRVRHCVGSWYIRSVMEQLNVNGANMDLVSILTLVSQNLVLYWEAEGELKQMPCFTSTLTKLLQLELKQ